MTQVDAEYAKRGERVCGEVMSLPKRSEIHPGLRVQIVEKQYQRTGALAEGVVARILTQSRSHPHGIKVMREDGKVGRVQAILEMPLRQPSRPSRRSEPAEGLAPGNKSAPERKCSRPIPCLTHTHRNGKLYTSRADG